MYHIWAINAWEKNPALVNTPHRTGLRLHFDVGVDPEVRRSCKEYAAFLRKEYFFPLRVSVYVKNKPYIVALDGDKVYGIFSRVEDDYTVEPSIKLSAGDYEELCYKWGKERALTAILLTMGHELTHYFQWINNLQLTPLGAERQATRYARFVLDEYAETRDHP